LPTIRTKAANERIGLWVLKKGSRFSVDSTAERLVVFGSAV
jgi:hypothetical protein